MITSPKHKTARKEEFPKVNKVDEKVEKYFKRD